MPISICADALKQIVIVATVLLEVAGQIQKRLAQATALEQKERDQESADAPVAIDEWMDGFKMLVHESALHEIRHRAIFIDELLPMLEALLHFAGRRWDVNRGIQCGVGR